MLTRRHCIAAAGLLPLAGAAHAQEFPKGPVRIVVPFPPGGPTDTVARMLAQQLQEIWGQPVNIDYKPGPAPSSASTPSPRQRPTARPS
jgi:tripartite-type tricarboxylate transporter receptor subunit TctC